MNTIMTLTKRHGKPVPGYEPGKINVKGVYVPTMAEVIAFQAKHVPWAHQVVYGYYTLAFLCGILVLAMIAHALWRSRLRYGPWKYPKLVAASRLLSYPRLRTNIASRVDAVWTTGPLGHNLILGACLLVTTCLTFANKYQYYPPFYGSAPLYLRAEWAAMAMLPFMYILAAKRNPITTLTGISHEKLQVLHQGSALIFTYLSLVHTVASCVRANRQHGLVLTLATNKVYVSGFVALAPMCVLVIGALPIFRRYTYETFYGIHIPMALFFLSALFWHGYHLLDSDAYCIATIIISGAATVWRLGMMLLDNPRLHSASLVMLDERTYTLSIPTTLRWKAGQHVFLRFLCRPLESHPFTIANAQSGEMQFLVRTKNGLTAALAAKGEGKYPVIIDGPYGTDGDEMAAFDNVLLVIGGSGISYGLSVAQSLSKMGKSSRVRLVWAVRHDSWMAWFEKELSKLDIDIDLFVTGGLSQTTSHGSTDSSTREQGYDTPMEKGEAGKVEAGKELARPSRITRHSGRPDIPALIASYLASSEGTVGIGGCGPESLITDTANAATGAQKDILAGRGRVTEVFLATESYAW